MQSKAKISLAAFAVVAVVAVIGGWVGAKTAIKVEADAAHDAALAAYRALPVCEAPAETVIQARACLASASLTLDEIDSRRRETSEMRRPVQTQAIKADAAKAVAPMRRKIENARAYAGSDRSQADQLAARIDAIDAWARQ